MQRAIQINLAVLLPAPTSSRTDDTPNFEVIFQVPPAHRLVLVRSRSRGGLMWGTYWGHEEYDASGQLIARYESFDEVSIEGHQHRGWCKFDNSKRLVGQSATLG